MSYKFQIGQEVKTDMGYKGEIIERKCSIFTLFQSVYTVRLQSTQSTIKGKLENKVELDFKGKQLQLIEEKK
jgi:hypothetical protein